MPVVAPSTEEPQVQMDSGSILAAIAPRLQDACDEIGIKAVESIRERISVPVEYGPGYIVRSDPGEPPRRETGSLTGSIDFTVTMENGLPALEVTAGGHARVLEDGGLNEQGHYIAARPFMAPEAELMREYAPQIVAANLSQPG